MNLDWTILHWIQDTLVCPALDFLMPKITLLGNGDAVWLLAAAALLITKKYRRYGVLLLVALALGVLPGNLTLKPLPSSHFQGFISMSIIRRISLERRCSASRLGFWSELPEAGS